LVSEVTSAARVSASAATARSREAARRRPPSVTSGDHHDEGEARDHERALPGPDHAGEQFPRRIVVRADPAAGHVCGDVLGELAGVGVAARRVALQRTIGDRTQLARHVGRERRRRTRRHRRGRAPSRRSRRRRRAADGR
jgi:hypothetical protein